MIEKNRFTLRFSPRLAVGIGVNTSDEDCSECSVYNKQL